MTDNDRSIYIGGDQDGHKLREELMEFLKSKGWKCVELGVFNGDETPYSRIETEVKDRVNIEEPGSLGILVFGKQSSHMEGEKSESKKES